MTLATDASGGVATIQMQIGRSLLEDNNIGISDLGFQSSAAVANDALLQISNSGPGLLGTQRALELRAEAGGRDVAAGRDVLYPGPVVWFAAARPGTADPLDFIMVRCANPGAAASIDLEAWGYIWPVAPAVR